MSTTAMMLVRQLNQADAPAMLAHLLRLDETDRVQRFARPASDDSIRDYVRRLDFERDAHYGVWQGREGLPSLIGLTHLALDGQGKTAEIGVSVDADQRRQGLAGRMLGRAILHARNLGVVEVVMYFLPYNTELMELARNQGMRLSVGEGQGIARLLPHPASPVSLASEIMETWADAAGQGLRDWSEGTLATSSVVCGRLRESANELY